MHFAPKVRRKCIRSLYKMCAGHTLLPSSLRFELPEGTMGAAQYRGGSADVLKRKCGGRDVAVKALRARGISSEGMRNVSHRWFAYILVRVDELIISLVEIL